ncbi:four helix bundle protein [Porticoccus sp. W117]|uniref:four helix bundle protein n=1 Tax=Porticoccus sp. W117 TaxID=3054777 RepID=UPI002596832F|nr:four helix bundle protein [Porticoccus sp. W117]MDM3870846.1 four helix bundle protein [Porticoccus sp. W117]
MKKYQKLVVWKQAMELAFDVYQMTKLFPDEEKFGLTSQMRRASVSIASNIAEGAGRGSDKDFVRFLTIARGSANELETQAMLAIRLGFLSPEVKFEERLDHVCAMLNSLINKLTVR